MTPVLVQVGEKRRCAHCGAAFNPALYRGATGNGSDVPPGQPAKESGGKLFHEGCALKMEAGRT
jgi:hypothetical protein